MDEAGSESGSEGGSAVPMSTTAVEVQPPAGAIIAAASRGVGGEEAEMVEANGTRWQRERV